MENQFHVEFVRNALYPKDDNERDLGFYDGIDLNTNSHK